MWQLNPEPRTRVPTTTHSVSNGSRVGVRVGRYGRPHGVATCASRVLHYAFWFGFEERTGCLADSGRLAQLGERRVRNAEVGSSILPPSTTFPEEILQLREWVGTRVHAL